MNESRQPLPWSGIAFRHVASNRDVVDFRFAGQGPNNRWNERGQPTLYLAGDPGVALAEWGRHLSVKYDEHLVPLPVQRTLYRLSLRFSSVVDIRDLGLERGPNWFHDIDQARKVAAQIRSTERVEAIIVPSIAFPDDLSRWNLVVFLERLGRRKPWITGTESLGALALFANHEQH